MSQSTRKNKSGGSAGGGGYDYQAEAYALVASKMLAEEPLPWAETGCSRIPVAVRMETGSGGDDILVVLASGARIEIQAKRGLQRGADLWDALLALADVASQDANTYGVLLTDTSASGTIRTDLRDSLQRIGEGLDPHEELRDIAQELVRRLSQAGLDPQAACQRVAIHVWDLDPGSHGEEATLSALRRVIANPDQAGAARGLLVGDGMDLIRLRGRRDAASLAKLLQQKDVSLSAKAKNTLVLREAYLRWCVERHSRFVIPGLHLPLPMDRAWVRLRTIGDQAGRDGGATLEERIASYHEWHRLAEAGARHDSIGVETAARMHRLLVVVGGPGAGKSTLLRRLAYSWAGEGKLLLLVRLRPVSLRMSQGVPFEQAVLEAASDSFPADPAALSVALRTATCLLADGLDETDPNRAAIAKHLADWALADEHRRVVVTTRAIGHGPAWFPGWEHLELLPLAPSDVRDLAHTVFEQLCRSRAVPLKTGPTVEGFTSSLAESKAAALASRNPLLLGFLLALYVGGDRLGGTRCSLYADVLSVICRDTRPDREYQYHTNEVEARRAIHCLGWVLMDRRALLEEELVEQVGGLLAQSFCIGPWQGQQMARLALSFWEERGLVEQVEVGAKRVFTFVYWTFQEHAAAMYLTGLPPEEFSGWVRQHYSDLHWREVLLLTGGTHMGAATVGTLLDADVADDPACVAAIVAAQTILEMPEPPSDLTQRLVQQLAKRLTSPVPMVAYEAGDHLIPFAPATTALLGPMLDALGSRAQVWTKEIACALGMLIVPPGVNPELLSEVYPTATDSTIVSGGYGGKLTIRWSRIGHELLMRGAEYLLQEGAPAEHVRVAADKLRGGRCSGLVAQRLHELLARHLSPDDLRSLQPTWIGNTVPWVWAVTSDAYREGERALLEAVAEASHRIQVPSQPYRPTSAMGAFAAVYHALGVEESALDEIAILHKKPEGDRLLEVLRGVLLVTAVDPAQVRTEAQGLSRLLSTPDSNIYDAIKDTEEIHSNREVDWSLVDSSVLDPAALADALRHPSFFVCRFAACLLCNCFDGSLVGPLLSNALASGGRHVPWLASQMAEEVWGKDAGERICSHLEQSMGPEAAPLVRALGRITQTPHPDRLVDLVERALSSTDTDMAAAGLHAMQQLQLGARLGETMRERYQWWLRYGPQDPRGGGTVPPSPTHAFLASLIAGGMAAVTDLVEAANSGRSDVRRVAVGELCHRMASDDALATALLGDVLDGRLPPNLVEALSQSQPGVCGRHADDIAALLESSDPSMQRAAIRAFGGGWAEHGLADRKLRPLLSAGDASLRDEAVVVLRRIRAA